MVEAYILGRDEAGRWGEVLARFGDPDIYFTLEYALTWNRVVGGEPKLFVYEDEGGLFAYPFRVRPLVRVPALADFGDWCDISSDYGYGGPLVLEKEEGSGEGFVVRAVAAFDDYCRRQKVVAEFCRFHPLLNNAEPVKDLYRPIRCGSTVWVDLILPVEEIRGRMRKNHRNSVNKAKRNGVEVRVGRGVEEVAVLHRLYSETMDKVGAREFYQFNRDFFSETIRLLPNNAVIFVAEHERTPLSACLYIFSRTMLHAHLAGNDERFGDLHGSKLIVYESMLWGKEKGLARLHIGGGYGAQDDDPLMLYKAGFSKLRAEYNVAKRIHHQAVYDQATEAAGAVGGESGHFPAYRSASGK